MIANPRPDTPAPNATAVGYSVTSYMTMVVVVGQLHPGQWATNVASGAQFGTELLGVLLGAHILTLLMQLIAFTLSMHTGQNLIQLCRAHSPQALVNLLWVWSALAFLVSDIAAMLALALAGQLLFGWALSTGVCVAAVVVVGVWHMHGRARSWLSVGLLIAICVGMAYLYTKTQVTTTTLRSSISGIPVFWHDPYARQLALAVVGASALPHTMALVTYLGHIQGAPHGPHTWRWRIGAIAIALGCAGVISMGSMLISASAFHGTAYQNIASIADAYALLLPVTGTIAAGFVLGFVVLATALMALTTNTRLRQVTWDSFVDLRHSGWSLRWAGTGVAIVSAWLIAQRYGGADPSPVIVQSHILLLIPLCGTGIVLFVLAEHTRRIGLIPTTTWVRWGRWLMVAVGMALSGYLLWGIW